MNFLTISSLVLTIVLLMLVFSSNSSFDNIQNLSKSLYNGTQLDGYRLADVIFYPDYLTSKHEYSTMDHLYKFPNTIGTRYIKQKYPFLQNINTKEDLDKHKLGYSHFEEYILKNLTKQSIDIALLNKIINENKMNEVNEVQSNTLYLHVRVADVLCKYNGQDHSYIYSKIGNKVWWNKVMDYVISNKINKIIIIAGTHFKDCLEESANYLENIKTIFNNHGIKVQFRVGYSPDEDLIFCKDAKHFITTGGGYGYFLGKIIELNGGKFALNEKDTVRKDRKLFEV